MIYFSSYFYIDIMDVLFLYYFSFNCFNVLNEFYELNTDLMMKNSFSLQLSDCDCVCVWPVTEWNSSVIILIAKNIFCKCLICVCL